MFIGLHAKYPLFLSGFNETLTSERFSKKKIAQISNFVKIRSVGAELLHADRRTDMTKLIVVFSQFLRTLLNRKNFPHTLYLRISYDRSSQ